MLAPRRLTVQQLARPAFRTAAEVVAWLGAVQAQDYLASKWALGLRLPGARDEGVERAVAEGAVLRTHALRGTWQYVAPADLRWLLELVRPRLVERNALMYRRLGLDGKTFRRGLGAMERALRGGQPLTRGELGAALRGARVSTEGLRFTFLLQRAELEGLSCGGPRRGKQPTWVPVDGRVPREGRRFARDEAIAELARRYFRSRGPATVGDFGWWSGLAARDARDGLEAVKGELEPEVAGGRTYWHAGGALPRAKRGAAHLLPAFDEYLVGYQSRDAVIDAEDARRVPPERWLLDPAVLLDGRVAGFWWRSLAANKVLVELEPLRPPSPRELAAFERAAERYGAFLGLPVELEVRPGAARRAPGRGRARSSRAARP